jgi:hypothetical protein
MEKNVDEQSKGTYNMAWVYKELGVGNLKNEML